jgi:hypothetical protein
MKITLDKLVLALTYIMILDLEKIVRLHRGVDCVIRLIWIEGHTSNTIDVDPNICLQLEHNNVNNDHQFIYSLRKYSLKKLLNLRKMVACLIDISYRSSLLSCVKDYAPNEWWRENKTFLRDEKNRSPRWIYSLSSLHLCLSSCGHHILSSRGYTRSVSGENHVY